MTPLVTLLVIGLLLVIVAALLVWALVSPTRGGARRRERAEAATGRPQARAVEPTASKRATATSPEGARPPAVTRSNDDLRGAKATRSGARESVPDDAFERFLRAGRDDDR